MKVEIEIEQEAVAGAGGGIRKGKGGIDSPFASIGVRIIF
jgi:hypothetical protein